MKYIIVIGIFQAISAAILLWRSRIRNHADSLLIMLVACIGIHLSIKFLIFTFVKDSEVLLMMNTFIGFCYMPLLYLYTLKIINEKFIPSSRWYVFIPFVIGTISYFSVVSAIAAAPVPGHLFLYWYNTVSLWSLLSTDIIFAIYIIYLAIYKLPYRLNERKLIIQVASLFLLIGLIGIVFTLIKPGGISLNYSSRSIIYALLVVISIRIITHRYLAFINPAKQSTHKNDSAGNMPNAPEINITGKLNEIQNDNSLLYEVDTTLVKEDIKTDITLIVTDKRKELLSQSEMFTILLKLENAMTKQRYYTDSELTLDKLSTLTKQNKYHISETLNHFLHKPFYTFINEYRIEHVKNRLEALSDKNIEVNMLELAYEAGFNSKSSFNRYFKEITSQTPTTYFRTIVQQVTLARG